MPRYECDHCGGCCKGPLIIEADALDVLLEPRLIDADPRHRGKTVLQMVEEIENDMKAVTLPNPCSFLSGENKCTIFPTRPNCCVALQAGDEQCQEARADAGLPPLNPVADAAL